MNVTWERRLVFLTWRPGSCGTWSGSFQLEVGEMILSEDSRWSVSVVWSSNGILIVLRLISAPAFSHGTCRRSLSSYFSQYRDQAYFQVYRNQYPSRNVFRKNNLSGCVSITSMYRMHVTITSSIAMVFPYTCVAPSIPPLYLGRAAKNEVRSSPDHCCTSTGSTLNWKWWSNGEE